jgi:hypothetical protein
VQQHVAARALEAADAEIIFNESNFGVYEKSGPQTFSLPAR